jgi:hypothetical protein
MRPVEHLAVERDNTGGTARFEQFDDAAGPRDLFGARREDLVDDRGLVGMDRGLGRESVARRDRRFPAQAFRVPEIRVDRVDGRRPRGRCRRRQNERASSNTGV